MPDGLSAKFWVISSQRYYKISEPSDLVYTENKSGPKTNPCGTLVLTLNFSMLCFRINPVTIIKNSLLRSSMPAVSRRWNEDLVIHSIKGCWEIKRDEDIKFSLACFRALVTARKMALSYMVGFCCCRKKIAHPETILWLWKNLMYVIVNAIAEKNPSRASVNATIQNHKN